MDEHLNEPMSCVEQLAFIVVVSLGGFLDVGDGSPY